MKNVPTLDIFFPNISALLLVPIIVYSLQLLELPDAQGILSNEFMLAPRIAHSERSLNSTKAS